MRTTLNLDSDVLDLARQLSDTLRIPFRQVVNEALRNGLRELERPQQARPYRTRARKLGLKAGRNLDNIQELLTQIESEDYR